MRSRGARLAALLLGSPLAVAAQNPLPPIPGMPSPQTIIDTSSRFARPRDSIAADSAKPPRELVKWAEPDSEMTALMDKPGYTATRYQGNQVYLDAPKRDLTVSGDGAVQRDRTLLVADTIFYSDTLHLLRATAPAADTITLRDPSQGTADLVAQNFLEYDVRTHRGLVSSLSTSSRQSGQTWYVYGHQAAVIGDTTPGGHNTSYAEDGTITSCNLAVPHYHFQSSEMKVVTGTIMVARPAVLYVADVPVMWLPFIFQDMRRGRHSGMLTPRFGLADIIRTTPTYVRQISNVGYYFAISDYTDALVALDWRSGAGATSDAPGWTRLDGEWRFRWLDQFLTGAMRMSYSSYTNGQTMYEIGMNVAQQYSQNSSLNAQINYSSNTQLTRYNAITVAQALASIASSLAFQDRLGPFAMSIGGSRTQSSGQSEVNTQFPTFSLSAQPINVLPNLVWTPALSVSNNVTTNLASSNFTYSSVVGGALDSAFSQASQRLTSFSLQTPFRIGGFSLPLSLSLTDVEKDLPQNYLIYDFDTGKLLGQRTYAMTFRTGANWETGVALPALLQQSWNITPFITIANAAPGDYWVRTEQTGGVWVSQSKTIQGGIGVQPTFYGFFPGFGPFARIRHAFQPRIAYTWAPASNIPDDYLKALNYTRAGYLGGLERSAITFQLLNSVEAKLKPRGDTANGPRGSDKVKLLDLNLSSLTYDFVIAHKIGRGITTPTFHWDVKSDLLPGFQIGADYSLFQGDVISDTARFAPFRTNLNMSFTIGRANNPFATFSRIFGTAAAPDSGSAGMANALAPGAAGFLQPAFGGPIGGRAPLAVQPTGAWSLSIIYTNTQSRPVTGQNVRTFDPRQYCAQYIANPIIYNQCLLLPVPSDSLYTTQAGAPVYVLPTQSTLRVNLGLQLTPHWALQATSGYDLVLRRFSDNLISLQRQLHDWHAVFAYTQAPNGTFTFNFFIALNAEPDLRFDYNRRNYGTIPTP